MNSTAVRFCPPQKRVSLFRFTDWLTWPRRLWLQLVFSGVADLYLSWGHTSSTTRDRSNPDSLHIYIWDLKKLSSSQLDNVVSFYHIMRRVYLVFLNASIVKPQHHLRAKQHISLDYIIYIFYIDKKCHVLQSSHDHHVKHIGSFLTSWKACFEPIFFENRFTLRELRELRGGPISDEVDRLWMKGRSVDWSANLFFEGISFSAETIVTQEPPSVLPK